MSVDSIILSGLSLNDSITNNITDETLLLNLSTNNNDVLMNIPSYNQDTLDGINNGFNYMLESIPIKTGCCLRTKDDNSDRGVNVRIQANPDAIGLYKKFGFEWKTMDIPPYSCPDSLYKGSAECNKIGRAHV